MRLCCIDGGHTESGSLCNGGVRAVLAGDPLPLRIGIHEEIVALATSPEKVVAQARGKYCRSKPYLAALITDESYRHDIDGNRVEPVTPEQRYAAAVLMNYKLLFEAKPKSQAGSRPNGAPPTPPSSSGPNGALPPLSPSAKNTMPNVGRQHLTQPVTHRKQESTRFWKFVGLGPLAIGALIASAAISALSEATPSTKPKLPQSKDQWVDLADGDIIAINFHVQSSDIAHRPGLSAAA